MKNLIILLLGLMFSVQLFANNQFPIYDNVELTDKYEFSPGESNLLYVSSPFAKPNLSMPNDIDNFKGREIKRITYLYSKNILNPQFNQNSLSDNRYKNLLNSIPEIKENKNIEWLTLVQASCKSNDCAKQLYHGFLIEFVGEKEKEVFTRDYIHDQNFKINPGIENTFEGSSGTRITVPANSFIRKNGQEVRGDVYVQIKEGVSIEDIVLGGLVTITADNKILESGGMVKITAYNEGYEVELKRDKSISVSVLNAKKEGMNIYSGVESQGELKWNNPVPLDEVEGRGNVNEVRNDDEVFELALIGDVENTMMTWKYELSSIKHQKSGDKIDWIEITYKEEEYNFKRESYTKEDGLKIGLNEFQANQMEIFFQGDTIQNIPFEFWGDMVVLENGKEVKNIENVFNKGNWRVNWGGESGQAIDGRNSFQEDTEIRTIFQTNSLGWANIDRLASFPNSRKVKFAVASNEIDSLQNLKISMVVPGKKMYLPGYKKADGNYSFTHGDYEEHTFPVGDQAYIIAIGEFGDETYFDMVSITLGENELENINLELTDKDQALNLIKETL